MRLLLLVFCVHMRLAISVAADNNDKSLLNSALKRAPAECHGKLVEGWERQLEGQLPLSFQMDPTAKEKCNPQALAVTPGPGSNGVINREPSAGRVLTNYSTEVRQAQLSDPAGEPSVHEEASDGEPLAFVIIASGEQTFENLALLLRTLDGPSHSYAIHLDSSAPQELHDALPRLALTMSQPDALIILSPIDVSWGGPSMLQVELEAMRALTSSARYWRHLLVLSGSDYPLRSVDAMSKRFGALGPFSHFEIFYQHDHFLKNRAFDSAFVECKGWTYKVREKRPRPKGLTLWGGSSWVSLSRTFTSYVVSCLFDQSKRDPSNFFRTQDAKQVDQDCRIATDLLAYMEHTQSAEELYLHTVFMNTAHCLQLNTQYWRWVHWGNRKGRHCDKSDLCGTSPQYMTDRELRTAFHFTPALFARKFASNDSLIRERADALREATSALARLVTTSSESGFGGAPTRQRSHAAPALDGNEFSAWHIPAPLLNGTTLTVSLGKKMRVCSVSLSFDPASLPASASFSLHHRTKRAHDWNTSLSSTLFSAAHHAYSRSVSSDGAGRGRLEIEAGTSGWQLYRGYLDGRAGQTPLKARRGVAGNWASGRVRDKESQAGREACKGARMLQK